MHAGLGSQKSKRVLPADFQHRSLDARFFTFALVQQIDLESSSLGPARVHPDEHRSPVLGLRSARAGADLDLRVAEVVLAAHQCLELERVDLGVECLDHSVQLLLELGVGGFAQQLMELLSAGEP
jgi:hypothetical protein